MASIRIDGRDIELKWRKSDLLRFEEEFPGESILKQGFWDNLSLGKLLALIAAGLAHKLGPKTRHEIADLLPEDLKPADLQELVLDTMNNEAGEKKSSQNSSASAGKSGSRPMYPTATPSAT